jgi:glycosyltransferase involved in cell wall biosynthesis
VKNSQRIIFIPFIYGFGGVERLILALSHFLYKRGIAHTVVCFNQTIDFSTYATWPMTVHVLAPKRNHLSESWALSRYLRAAHQAGSPPPLLFDLKGAFYAGLLRKMDYYLHLTDPPSMLPSEVSKFAFSVRSTYPLLRAYTHNRLHSMLRSELVHRINRRGASNAISVIAMSNVIADELQVLYNVEAKIIRPGVEKRNSLPLLPLHTLDSLRMLSVCRLEENKRLDWVLNALADLEFSNSPLSKKVDWKLDLVGDGSIRENLQNLSRQRGIADRVIFHGRILDIAVQNLFDSSDLFLMPAIQGYGLPALEALSSSIPIIIHQESGVSEILKGTPWVEIIKDGPNDLRLGINLMVDRLLCGEFKKSNVPTFPSDIDWARDVVELCHWI